MLEFRLLKPEEVEVRLARVTDKGVMLLVYKDARVDQTILDETVGAYNWQRRHTRDNHNCIVAIWDNDKQQWIEKEDVGTESNTESEKGLASDSFKRACFNWGIGRELYTSPFIFFNSAECNVKEGRCYDKFYCTNIEYDGRKIKSLNIYNKDTDVTKVFKNERKTPSADIKKKVEKKVEERAERQAEKDKNAELLKKKRCQLTALTKGNDENTQKYVEYMKEHNLTNDDITLEIANELIIMLSDGGKK